MFGAWAAPTKGIQKIGLALAAGAALVLSACETVPDDMPVAEYCANPDKATKAICKLNVEIDGQKQALAQTNMTVAEARSLAEQASAKADAAMLREDELYCETRTLNRTDIGTCSAGYKVMSCTQTRYTYKAGGLSFLREIDDSHCRFNSKVLEMQVRCCMAGAAAKPTEMPAAPEEPAKLEEAMTSS